jgi:hypothetical protein
LHDISQIKGVGELDCPLCKVEMRYDEKRNYHVCGCCLGEFWPKELEKERGEYKKQTVKTKDSMFFFGLAEQTTAINSKPVNPPGVPNFKGGGSKNGKKRKKKIRNRNIMLET